MSKQDLPKLFDRFYRVDPSRTHEGGSYGLGLSIAKAIVDSLGGKIHAESVENESTTFTFTLGI
ncbi:ATP-binding protein [Clostridium sp. BJN0013]|uniref:ATP-binding protein n=1 Tax=Clostridium sp. BJN0013 TaxID=3236840 RepID=UPI0034C61153